MGQNDFPTFGNNDDQPNNNGNNNNNANNNAWGNYNQQPQNNGNGNFNQGFNQIPGMGDGTGNQKRGRFKATSANAGAQNYQSNQAPHVRGPFNAVYIYFRYALDFTGRSTRLDFWETMGGLFLCGILFGIGLVIISIVLSTAGLTSVGFYGFFSFLMILRLILLPIEIWMLIGTTALTVRRWRDTGLHGGALIILSAITLIIWFPVDIVMGCIPTRY